MLSVPATEPRRVYLAVLDEFGQSTFCVPTVTNATQPHRMKMRKHRVIFSLHACTMPLSFNLPTDLRRKEGAQKVTILENNRHGSMPLPGMPDGIEPDALGDSDEGGLMSGTGATLRSGRVSVLARRMVVPVEIGGRVVRTGTSLGAKVG